MKDSDCIGGYTEAAWSSNREWKEDKKALLFNATKFEEYPSQKKGKDIWCSEDCGPCFDSGFGSDLTAYRAPFNGF